MGNEVLLLNKLDNDLEWFKKNQTDLENKYNDQFIAIENGNVIENDKSLDHLLSKLEKIGKSKYEAYTRYKSKKSRKIIFTLMEDSIFIITGAEGK